MNNDYAPVVSVVVLSYNFRNYLKECLDSVLAQKTDIPFEIIVADDASTDGSDELIREYESCHPDRIRPLIQSSNIGPKLNIAAALRAVKGEYIAYIDGDDLMADTKLAKQVAFMKAHPSCSLVAHQVEMRLESKGGRKRKPAAFPIDGFKADMDALCRIGYFIPTPSLMFRASAVPSNGFPVYPCARAYDFCRVMILAQSGNLGLIHEILGTYRVHGSGTSAVGKSDIWRLYYGQRRALQVAQRAGCSSDACAIGLAKLRLRTAVRYLKEGEHKRFKKTITCSRMTRKLHGWRQFCCYHFRHVSLALRGAWLISRWLR